MDINSALQKIFSMHQFTIKLGLERVTALLDHVGNPHKKLKCFHIAGSNGKGSTASFIASILMEAGYKVGLYTSPHFVRFNERIRINGKEIDDKYIAKFIDDLGEFIDDNEPTFFEITTALAFKYFAEQNVDYAVIETGLGGRLDATNTITPLASIITSISLEHTNILGDTIELIAAEKAGIIKPNTKVFLGFLPDKALSVIEKKASENKCELFKSNNFVVNKSDFATVQARKNCFNLYHTHLLGMHQIYNAALAVKSIYEVLMIDAPEIFIKGIKNVIVNTGIQGRYEFANIHPTLIFDSAHNPEGISIFVNEFEKHSIKYDQKYLLFGALKDKNILEMLSKLEQQFDKIYLTKINNERSADPSEILSQINKDSLHKYQILDDYLELIGKFLKGSRENCLVVLGSMYLLGEIKSKIDNKILDKKN